MTEAYLSLGSNIGDRLENLSRAVALLDREEEGVSVVDVSPVFETKPVGSEDHRCGYSDLRVSEDEYAETYDPASENGRSGIRPGAASFPPGQ